MNQTKRMTEKQANALMADSVGKYLNKPLSKTDYRAPARGGLSLKAILYSAVIGSTLLGIALRVIL